MGTKSLIKKIRFIAITLLATSVMALSPAYALDFGDTGQETGSQISSTQEAESDVSFESDEASGTASKNSLTISAPGIMESGWGRYDGMTVLKGYGDYTIRLPETIYLGQQGGGNFVGNGGYEVDTDDGQKVSVTVQNSDEACLESEGLKKELSYEQDPYKITTTGPGEEGKSHTVSNNILVKGTDLSKGTWKGALQYKVHVQNRHALMFYYTGLMDGGGIQNMSAGPIYVYHGEKVNPADIPNAPASLVTDGKNFLGPLWVDINQPDGDSPTGYTSEQLKDAVITKDMSFTCTWFSRNIGINIHHMYGPSTKWQRNGESYNDADEIVTKMTIKWNGEDYVDGSFSPGTQTLTRPTELTRTGYTLEGIYYDKAFTHEYRFNSQGVGLDVITPEQSGLNLYCKWKPLEYTATYNLNDSLTPKAAYPSSPALKTKFTVEDTFTLPQPVRKDSNGRGYTFAGWTGTNVSTAQKVYTVPKGTYRNLSFTANWTPDLIPVTYDMNYNAKTNEVKTINVNYNATFNDGCKPSESGYTFLGWFTAKSGGTARSSTRVTAPERVYAHWDLASYTITFKSNPTGTSTGTSVGTVYGMGSNGDTTVTAKYKSTVNAPQPTCSDGSHTFSGWYTEPGYSNGTRKGTATVTVPLGNVVYYAHWKKKSKVTATFDGNGGTINSIQRVVSISESSNNNGTNSDGTDSGRHHRSGSTSNTTYTLRTEGGNTITVKYNENSGSLTTTDGSNASCYFYADASGRSQIYGINEIKSRVPNVYISIPSGKTTIYDYTGTYHPVPTATRSGYTFLGWYTAANGGTKTYSPNSTIMLTGTATYYAHWSTTTSYITSASIGGSASLSAHTIDNGTLSGSTTIYYSSTTSGVWYKLYGSNSTCGTSTTPTIGKGDGFAYQLYKHDTSPTIKFINMNEYRRVTYTFNGGSETNLSPKTQSVSVAWPATYTYGSTTYYVNGN